LADKIELLMNDPKLCKRLGQVGPQRVAERFSVDEMIRKTEALYAKCLGQPAN
jgi:glycosyltransferase involved in cell wall biosynthesis